MTDALIDDDRLSAESTRLPTQQEVASASLAVSVLARALAEADDLVLTVKSDSENLSFQLSHSVGTKFMELLSLIAQGDSVTLVPYGAALTTQEAADLLNVSRPYLVSLLEARTIPFYRVGSHRRILAQHVFGYKDRRQVEREDGLRELQRLGQEADAIE